MENTSKPTLVILAAGMGSRYGGLKQLDGVGPNNETIIEYSIYDAIEAGFGKVVCVVRKDFIEAFYMRILAPFEDKIACAVVCQEIDTYVPRGINVTREKPWGTGHAILCAKDEVRTPFAVINADDFYGRESFVRIAEFLSNSCSETHYGMVGFLLKNTLSPFGPVSRGVCTTNDENKLVTVREHSNIEEEGGLSGEYEGENVALGGDLRVSMNLWAFHPNIFTYLETRFEIFVMAHLNDPKAEFYIPLAVNELLSTGKIEVSVIPSEEKWYGVTYKEDRSSVVDAIGTMIENEIYPNALR